MIDHNTVPHFITQKAIPSSKYTIDDFVRGLALPALPIDHFDERELEQIVDQFKFRLYLLRMGARSPGALSNQEGRAFTEYLIKYQNTRSRGHYAYGSWPLIRYKSLRRQVAYDYVHRPSQIALAWLVLIRTRYPALEQQMDGFQQALDAGFEFMSKDKLRGAGYESNTGLVASLERLSIGGVFSYASGHRQEYSEFARQLDDAKEQLAKPYIAGSWDNASPLARSRALTLIDGADADDAFICPQLWEAVGSVQRGICIQRLLKEVPAKVANKLEGVIVESIEGNLEQIKLAYKLESPKYVVFERNRPVQSKPIIIDRYFDLLPIAMESFSSFAILPWTGSLSVEKLLNDYSAPFWSEVSRRLSVLIQSHESISDLEFNIRIRSITDHKADGYLIDLIAERKKSSKFKT